MPALPKPLLNLAASWHAARARRRIRSEDAGGAAQDLAWRNLLPPLAQTARGQALGLTADMSYDDFRLQVPLSDFADLAPWTSRIIDGESNVMWPGDPVAWVATAGTTTGAPRLLPVSEAMADHVAGTTLEMLLQGAARTGDDRCLRGRHLLLAGRTSQPDAGGHLDISTLSASFWPAWYERAYALPSPATFAEMDWAALVNATIQEAHDQYVTVLCGQPPWLIELARRMVGGPPTGKEPAVTLRSFWPDLRCIMHGGTQVLPYRDELLQLAGQGVTLHEIHYAAEGLFGAQDSVRGLRLLAEQGIFFEFLPRVRGTQPPFGSSGARALSLAEIKLGSDYELLVTTPGGLVRHRVGDIVRFSSLRPPRYTVVGHADLLLNAYGEQLNEHDLTEHLVDVCADNQWKITQFHVAPLPSSTEQGKLQGRHEWWVELDANPRISPRGPAIATRLDSFMLRAHPRYAELRNTGVLSEPIVRLVMPGAFKHWMQHHRLWGGPHRLARARSDRMLADSIARTVRFSTD